MVNIIWVPSNLQPKLAGKLTARDDMISIFILLRAYVTCSFMNYAFSGEVYLAMYTVLGQEPSKEANSWRGEVVPDKGKGGVLLFPPD